MFYGSAAGFISYHEARGRDVSPTWDDDAIEAALLLSSEWVDGIYGSSFVGHKTAGFLQELEWPRTSATVKATGPWGEYYIFPDSVIPDRVINATYEAAFKQLTTPGSLQVDYTPSRYKSVAIDGAIDVEYVQFSSSHDVQTQFAAIDTILWPLLDTSAYGRTSVASGKVTLA